MIRVSQLVLYWSIDEFQTEKKFDLILNVCIK